MKNVHFEWKDDYNVHVALIDGQHKELIKIIDDLYQSILQKNSNEIISQIFDRLNAYAIYHFGTEEKYFKEFGYPHATEHMDEHEKYKTDITKMEQDEKDGKLEALQLLMYLENWWVNHILNVDKKYSEFFNEHGLH